MNIVSLPTGYVWETELACRSCHRVFTDAGSPAYQIPIDTGSPRASSRHPRVWHADLTGETRRAPPGEVGQVKATTLPGDESLPWSHREESPRSHRAEEPRDVGAGAPPGEVGQV